MAENSLNTLADSHIMAGKLKSLFDRSGLVPAISRRLEGTFGRFPMSFEKASKNVLISSEAASDAMKPSIFRFDRFTLHISERQLMNAEQPVHLTPKVFDCLVYLVQRAGRLVSKEELMEGVWPDSFVEEANLTRNIHILRKVLGQTDEKILIETVPTKGYRFVAEVRSETPATKVESDLATTVPEPIASPSSQPSPVSAPIGIREPITARSSKKGVFLIVALLVMATVAAGAAWFLGGEVSQAFEPETMNGQALLEYKQGKMLVERRYPGDYPKALEHFERAIALDPNYSNAYAGKADVKVVMFWGSASHQDISEARTAVRKAIDLNPSNSYARTIHCRILTTYDWDHSAAEAECRRAVEIDPNDHEAQKELAFLLNSLGREEEALSAIDRAIAVAPTSFNKRSKGLILYHSRRYDEAIELFDQVDATDSEFKETTRWLMRAWQMKGSNEKMLELYVRLMEQAGSSHEEIETLRTAIGTGGWQMLLEHMAGNSRLRTIFQAGTYAQMGQTEKAFDVLREMESRRAILLITAAREPSLDPIRNDPRFRAMLERIGLAGVAAGE
jgi:DNA-binding winged helix-turn-helix (wHTH) protein/tetratricopeptide (TPR) repeat protein